MERKVTLPVTAQKKNLVVDLREVDLGKEAVAAVVATMTETAQRVEKTKIEVLHSLVARTEATTDDLVMVTSVEREETTLEVVTVKTELIATGDLEGTEIELEIENLTEIIETAAPMEGSESEGLTAAVPRMVNPDQEPALIVEKKVTSQEIVHSLTSVKTVEAVIEEKGETTMGVAV